jgi:hypothetical protein
LKQRVQEIAVQLAERKATEQMESAVWPSCSDEKEKEKKRKGGRERKRSVIYFIIFGTPPLPRRTDY